MRNKNPAQRRYVRRIAFWMTAYVVVLLACTRIRVSHPPEGPWLFVLSALPALPLLSVIVVMGVYLTEERDEFLRARLVMAMLGGTGIFLAFMTVWGFLEHGKAVPHFATFLSFPIWCAGFGLANGAIALRDRFGPAGE